MNKTPVQILIDSLIDRHNIAHITELADRVKMHQPTLLRIYNGQVPKYKTIRPLLDYFGISYDRFLQGGSIDQEAPPSVYAAKVEEEEAAYQPHDKDTQKMLRAWETLAPSTRKHFIALMEVVGPQKDIKAKIGTSQFRPNPRPTKKQKTA